VEEALRMVNCGEWYYPVELVVGCPEKGFSRTLIVEI